MDEMLHHLGALNHYDSWNFELVQDFLHQQWGVGFKGVVLNEKTGPVNSGFPHLVEGARTMLLRSTAWLIFRDLMSCKV